MTNLFIVQCVCAEHSYSLVVSGRIDLEKSRLEIGPKPPGAGIGAIWRLAGICTDEARVAAIELSLKM